MLEKWLVILREAVPGHSYIISTHAKSRMGERSISVFDIDRCALQGTFIESQDHGRDPIALIQGVDEEGEKFYMAVALRYPRPVIVTVCRFLEEAWEDLGQFKQRKRRQ